MKRGLLTMVVALICAMVCAFGLVACDNNENPNENGNNGTQTVAVESVTLNKTELALEVGGEETLTATVAPDNATDKAVTWSSDNTAIATVENGKVTAIAAGTATITAKAGDKTDTCSVTVNAAEPTVNGKTFIFYDLTSDDLSSEMLATMKSQMENTTIVFTNEGTFTITQTIDTTTIVQTGSYEQENSSVLMTIETMTSNGRPVEGADENLPITVQGTFDGEQFSFSTEAMPDTFVTNIFVIKTN